MNGFHIKVLAFVLMVFDHVGALFFPEQVIFRMVGRLSFPLFAWLLAVGYQNTRSVRWYMLRLLLFCTLSEIPYLLAFRPAMFKLNILFTLYIGLVGLWCFDNFSSKVLRFVALSVLTVMAEQLNCDYGAYGVITIFLFGIYHNDFSKLVVMQIVLNTLRQVIVVPLAVWDVSGLSLGEWWVWAQPLALFALPIVCKYNGQRGLRTQYLFYAFYPVHLLVLYFVRIYMGPLIK